MVGGTLKAGDFGRLDTETTGAATDLITKYKTEGEIVNVTAANMTKSIGLAATEIAYATTDGEIKGDLTKLSYDDDKTISVGDGAGNEGRIDLYPTSASKGRIRYSSANNAGNTLTEILNASQAGTRTYTIPDANAAAAEYAMNVVTEITLTSAQILALNAMPIEVIAAPGSGFVTIVKRCYATKAAGTAYAGVAAGEDIALKYTNSSGDIAAQLEMTGFADSTSATQALGVGIDALPVDNAAIVAHMLVGEIITGDSDFLLRIESEIVKIPAF